MDQQKVIVMVVPTQGEPVRYEIDVPPEGMTAEAILASRGISADKKNIAVGRFVSPKDTVKPGQMLTVSDRVRPGTHINVEERPQGS